MVDYPNFYSHLKEAEIRLNSTIVLYDDEPHFIYCVTDHKSDGIFRVYMEPLNTHGEYETFNSNVPMSGHPSTRGDDMDKYLESKKNSKIVRKMMNSPKFNKFRPFPLGMMNTGEKTYYLQRSPTRNTQQGLMSSAINGDIVSIDPNASNGRRGLGGSSIGVSWDNPNLYDVIKGNYPEFGECLSMMRDNSCTNQTIGFSRDFALLRGPLDLVFLSYKGQTVGHIPEDTLPTVNLGKGFKYLKEQVSELRAFKKIS